MTSLSSQFQGPMLSQRQLQAVSHRQKANSRSILRVNWKVSSLLRPLCVFLLSQLPIMSKAKAPKDDRYYKLLEVEPAAATADIKKAYRKLAVRSTFSAAWRSWLRTLALLAHGRVCRCFAVFFFAPCR